MNQSCFKLFYSLKGSIELIWFCNSAAAAKSLQSCPTLCDPIDRSPQGSPVPGILQARTLEWAAISFSNVWKWKVKVKSLSHFRLLVTPMVCSLPGSSVHGIFQARVLEWGDYSHEIKRHLHLGRKVMTNLDSLLKSRDITFPKMSI